MQGRKQGYGACPRYESSTRSVRRAAPVRTAPTAGTAGVADSAAVPGFAGPATGGLAR
jgi:hypothetical protein